jgi:hypothetical protein
MSPLIFLPPCNVLGFLEKYANKKTLKSLLESEDSVDLSSPEIDYSLSRCEFPKVLTALWKEPDIAKKVTWLVSKSQQLHPILLYEEAIAKFSLHPTSDGLTNEMIPLMDAAYFRLYQDAQCSLNSDVKTHLVDRIHELFQIRFSSLVFKQFQKPFFELEMQLKNKEICALKVQEVAKLSLSTELPSPVWLGECGMNMFSVGKPNMAPAAMFDTIRKTYAQEQLSTGFFMKGLKMSLTRK